MPRLIIVSNRLPVTVNRKQGELIFYPSAGGLATGLNSLDESIDKIWIGWPGEALADESEQESVRRDLAKDKMVPVYLSEEEIELYYEGFSNKVIWPHFHYFTQFTAYEDRYWDAYRLVNEIFARVVVETIQPGDQIWVHDYQLLLLPAMIRKSFPDISIGFFLHIPFPSYEIFRMLPWREELLLGMLGADQIGFHTFGYMRHFLSAAYRICGYEHFFGQLTVGKRVVNVDVFPMGIDYDKYAFPDVDESARKDMEKIRTRTENRKLVITIDRLDYTKGIPHRVKVFARFLKKYPKYRNKVTMVLIVVPSRANVDEYRDLKTEIDTLVGDFNSKFSTFSWMPIIYFYRSLNFSELTSLYKVADIAMITPLRDGMNLVAKEYVAAKEESKKGVLILSEMAGASNELYDALIVNPQDVNEMAEALHTAIEMPEEEQRIRMEKMQIRLKKYTVTHWVEDFMNEQTRLMEEQKGENTKQLTEQHIQELLAAYRKASSRLIVLDYDGTLMGFMTDPAAVVPDKDLLSLLDALVRTPGNRVVVNSGRDRNTLDKWLSPTGADMAAEHGVWVKMGGRWKSAPGLVNRWKKDIRPVLDSMVERTPGSFIEEKDYSLAWHYRMTDKDLGEKRVREFRDVLLYLTANLDLQVLEGNKVVEIKNAGVNKGKSMLHWLSEREWDFILAVGDDQTDEDTFREMPPHAFTIKVGLEKTAAKYQVAGVDNVREVISQLVS